MQKKKRSNSVVMNLLLILNENDKNNFNKRILQYLDTFNDNEKLDYIIEILKKGFCTDDADVDKLLNQLISHIKAGNVRRILPQRILQMIVDKSEKNMSLSLRKEIFIQEFFKNIPEEQIIEKADLTFFRKANYYLKPYAAYNKTGTIKVKVNPHFYYEIQEHKIDKEILRTLQSDLKKMELFIFSEFFSFLINPTFPKYNQLLDLLQKEDILMQKICLKSLHYYIPDRIYKDSENFNKVLNCKQDDTRNFNKRNIKILMFRETDINLSYGIAHDCNVIDNLFDCGFIEESEIANLNLSFLKSFLFVASVQLQVTKELKRYTVKRIVKLIKEIDKRSKYYDELNIMIALLINSSSEDILFKELPDLKLGDLMIKREIIEKSSCHRLVISSGEIELAISKIITKICYDARESNYLSLIPTIINDKVDIYKCISKLNIMQIEKIFYRHSANKLTVKLLKLCMEENSNPKDLLDEVFSCNLSPEIIYLELEIFLRYCNMANKEALYVMVYMRLQDENFNEKSVIQGRLLHDMYEMRCNNNVDSVI